MAGVLLLCFATAQGPEAALPADSASAVVPAEGPEFVHIENDVSPRGRAERPELVYVKNSALAVAPLLNASSLPNLSAGAQ